MKDTRHPRSPCGLKEPSELVRAHRLKPPVHRGTPSECTSEEERRHRQRREQNCSTATDHAVSERVMFVKLGRLKPTYHLPEQFPLSSCFVPQPSGEICTETFQMLLLITFPPVSEAMLFPVTCLLAHVY